MVASDVWTEVVALVPLAFRCIVSFVVSRLKFIYLPSAVWVVASGCCPSILLYDGCGGVTRHHGKVVVDSKLDVSSWLL